MRKKRYKDHGEKREGNGFLALPHVVLRSDEFANLSPRATKLMLDLLAQYKGDNNGDLCAAVKLMGERGWRSKDRLAHAVRELLHKSFLVVTRQGGRHRASLYGVTFFDIDWCNGKLDIEAPTRKLMGAWHREKPAPQVGQTRKDCPANGAIDGASSANCPAGRSSQAPFDDSCAPRADSFLEIPLPAAAVQPLSLHGEGEHHAEHEPTFPPARYAGTPLGLTAVRSKPVKLVKIGPGKYLAEDDYNDAMRWLEAKRAELQSTSAEVGQLLDPLLVGAATACYPLYVDDVQQWLAGFQEQTREEIPLLLDQKREIAALLSEPAPVPEEACTPEVVDVRRAIENKLHHTDRQIDELLRRANEVLSWKLADVRSP